MNDVKTLKFIFYFFNRSTALSFLLAALSYVCLILKVDSRKVYKVEIFAKCGLLKFEF